MDTVGREKIPKSRLPITRDNVSLHTKPPAPGPKVHGRPTRRSPPRSPPPPVILTQPRPPGERLRNVYVETPRTNISVVNPHIHSISSPIQREPEPLKDPSPDPDNDICTESIICPNCDRCKCKSCATPRELPRKWMCGNTECSLQCAVEQCSCLWVVKCLFETLDIRDKEHDSPLSDDPCACCEQPHCCQRWTCIGLLSLCLPCLCFYPFLKCGLVLCTACYDRVTRKGCTCRAKNVPGSKKLLIEHENSSST